MGSVNFNEEFKDKGLKIAVYIVLAVVLIILNLLSVLTLMKLNKGEHVKLFGLEYNIPKEHPDTVIKVVKSKSDTIVKFSQASSNNHYSTYTQKKIPKAIEKQSNDTSKKIADQLVSAKNVLKGDVNGGNVQIGDTYNGLKQRHLNDADALNILLTVKQLIGKNKDWDGNPMINFNIPMSDEEASNYLDEIYSFLYNKGYTKFMSHNVMYGGRRPGDYKIKKDTTGSSTYISIYVYPQKNVN